MRMDILIVEDQRRIAEGLSVMLSSCKEDGIQIERTLIADNGVQALKMLEQQPVDLLITDIRMPIMDGLELMRRCSVQHRDVPFIILSGYDDFKYAQKPSNMGQKPICSSQLTGRRCMRRSAGSMRKSVKKAVIPILQGGSCCCTMPAGRKKLTMQFPYGAHKKSGRKRRIMLPTHSLTAPRILYRTHP